MQVKDFQGVSDTKITVGTSLDLGPLACGDRRSHSRGTYVAYRKDCLIGSAIGTPDDIFGKPKHNNDEYLWLAVVFPLRKRLISREVAKFVHKYHGCWRRC